MPLDFRLCELPMPRVGVHLLANASRALQETTRRNIAKAAQGSESAQFKNRKEEMKRRLISRRVSETFEQATAVVGRQRLLLSLYLEYAARSDAGWLPAFDEAVARSVLGESGRDWHGGRRRQATSLFFTHFERLPVAGLSRLCARLVESYDALEGGAQGDVVKWQQHRRILFTPAGPQGVARSAVANETSPALMARFAVPNAGRFTECLRQELLLNGLRGAPFGQEVSALTEIEAVRSERASSSLLMGAAALQIIVQRVAWEGKRRWSGDWPKWITRLGCDPRYGRATAEGAKWWGWATDDELRLAQQGITGLTLRFFVEFLQRSLQGTNAEPQFTLRSRFLIGLYEAGKIQSARLALHSTAYYHLDPKYRDGWSVARLSTTTDETSMICLRCVNDIFIIEGTHTFGLRIFQNTFPIPGFWERPKSLYQDKELRVSPGECPVFLRHDKGGSWVRNFFRELRSRFHVEWNDVRV